ncbi:MAG: cell division protein FtsQ/DivIB [Spongiibacteraceae bacterium]
MSFFGFGGGKKQGASLLRKKSERRKHSQQHVRAPAPSVDVAVKRKVKAERKPLPWRSWGLQSMPVIAVTLVLGLFAGGWTLLNYVGSVPVSRVAVTGALLHTDRNLLVERVKPYLRDQGFMTVDLDAIRAELKQLPWIDDVSIQRRWPDQLVIEVTEQEAIARWGKDGLLNRRGEVFRPQPLGDVSQLPLLYGPDNLSSEVVERYAQMRELLNEQKLLLRDLGSDERGSWSATLQSGVVLRLGTGDILKKMRSFSRVYQAELNAQMDRIAYIDLRYGNGLAVGWKDAGWKDAGEKNTGWNDKNTNSGVSGHG